MINCRNVFQVALHPIDSNQTRSPWENPAMKSADMNTTLVFSIQALQEIAKTAAASKPAT